MNYFIALLRDVTNFRRTNATASPRQCKSGERAFTLSELLVVMAVISVMSAAAMPALRTILDTRSMTTGAYDLAGLLELARSEAIARQTYVWVGATTEMSAGQTSTVFVPVYSRDGTSTNTDPSNLVPLSPPMRLMGMKLVQWSALRAGTKALVSATPASVCDSAAGIKFTVGTRTFDGQTITYTPGGEVLLRGKVTADDGYDSAIDLSFLKVKGTTVPANSEDVAVLVQGSTGAVKIVRMQ
ncbi:MAG: Tfp pilus assembly protein FimT/FimU [Candidatus Methylacidiphilales bacterium]|nr:GspH/FimT family pseudopilin [Candidatus Methylacidiphilales bacterium]